MNKHIRYILHGLYEMLIFMFGVGAFVGLALGLVFAGQWAMTADHPIPFIVIAIIALGWFLGFSKELGTKYKY